MESKPKKKYNDSFTPEQKEEYKKKKEAQKEELYELYKKFVEKHTIQDFIGIIANYKTMHKYTLRNICLVLIQKEKRQDNKFVGVLNSYLNWKKQNIQVLKGSKGYNVLVPIFTKVKSLESESPNQDQEEESKKVLAFFKLGNVFDISQTSEFENYIKESKEIDKVIMKNAEIDYSTALKFVRENFPELIIKEDFKQQDTKGQYNPSTKEITLYERSSHTVLHELSHHIVRYCLDLDIPYAKNKVLAELGAYLIMIRFNKHIAYNFKYSNVWSNRITDTFELEEFENFFKRLNNFLKLKLF
jgi:hypothetical protein